MITLTPQLRTVNKSKSDKNKPFLVLIKRPKKIKLSMLLIANTKIIANSFFVILCSRFRLTDFFVNSSIVSFVFFICKKIVLIKAVQSTPGIWGFRKGAKSDFFLGVIHKRRRNILAGRGSEISMLKEIRRQKLGKSGSKFRHGGGGYQK